MLTCILSKQIARDSSRWRLISNWRLTVNVCRSGPTFEATLKVAWNQSRHILALQESPINVLSICACIKQWYIFSLVGLPKVRPFKAKDCFSNAPELIFAQGELVVTEINGSKLRIASCYRTPSTDIDLFKITFSDISNVLGSTSAILCGDSFAR